MFLLGYRHVSAPTVKLQKTLKESLEQPWLGSIQYSPAGGDKETNVKTYDQAMHYHEMSVFSFSLSIFH